MGDARLNGNGNLSSTSKDWSKSHQGRFQKLLETGFLSDLQIYVGDKMFRAHTLIVATHSPILYEKICQSSSKTGGKYCMEEDADPGIFLQFLKFLYTGVSEDLSVLDALPLLKLAVTYKVFDLEAKCHSLLNEDLTDETAIQIYQQAVHYRDAELSEKALRYVCRNAWSILDSNEFTNLTLDNLKNLLFSEKLLVLNETQLIGGLFRWARKECDRKNENPSTEKIINVMTELSSCVSWELVNPDRFEGSNVTELETLFNAFYTHPLEDMRPKRQCKFSRKYFEDDDSSYTMSRFPQKFAYCTDNKSSEPEIVKFKTDVAICLLSIGIPAYSQTGGDHFQAKIEIWADTPLDFGNKSKGAVVVVEEKVPHSQAMYHLRFRKPYKIKKDTWYTVSGTITGAPGYGNMGGKCVQHLKCVYPNGSETTVKFEFRSGGGPLTSTSTSTSTPEDLAGGRIDEFSFKLVEN